MRLTSLNPTWERSGGEGVYNFDGTPAKERTGIGVGFDCPCDKCTKNRELHKDDENYSLMFRHYIIFANPLDGGGKVEGMGHTWNRVGDTFDTLQLTPSIRSDPAKGGCGWHGYIGLTIPGEVTTV